MNISNLTFTGNVGNELYIARNDAQTISEFAQKNAGNSTIKGMNEACSDIFENLSLSVVGLKEEKAFDAYDIEEAKYTREFMQELIEKNKVKPFVSDHILRSCNRLIKIIDQKFQELKKTFENL